jgi:hypothetical protein
MAGCGPDAQARIDSKPAAPRAPNILKAPRLRGFAEPCTPADLLNVVFNYAPPIRVPTEPRQTREFIDVSI